MRLLDNLAPWFVLVGVAMGFVVDGHRLGIVADTLLVIGSVAMIIVQLTGGLSRSAPPGPSGA